MFFYTSVFVTLLSVMVILAIDTTTLEVDYEDGSTEATATCTDVISNCAQYVNTLCKKKEYADIMYKECRSTCGMCSLSSEPCIDNQRACAKWNTKGFCASAFYTAKEKKNNCAATCNLCTPAEAECFDVNHNCANWNLRGFCASPAYNYVTKWANCAATCQLC